MDDNLYRVIRNRCQCRQCDDIIESKHRHDFVRCRCGAIFTDGGTAYIRRGSTRPWRHHRPYLNTNSRS
jgi:hypothetical protein